MSENALSDAQKRTLTILLDCLIPPDAERGLPGAGALGLAEDVESKLGAMASLIGQQLEALDQRARREAGEALEALAPAERTRIVQSHSESEPDFLGPLLYHGFAAYYQQPSVLEALGMPGRPPHPIGYEIGPHDASLLDPVRDRGRFYREV